MTNREMSERLCVLACMIEVIADEDADLLDIAKELHDISNDNYVPGNGTSWADLKREKSSNAPSKKPRYLNQQNRELPF